MTKYLIQHNGINAQSLNKIKDALTDIPHQFIGVIPFTREITFNEPIVGEDYIPYGSTLLTTTAYDWYCWKGLYFDLDTFNYEEYVKNRQDMLNKDMIMSVEDTIAFMRKQNSNNLWFVRPNLDLKQFTGQVIEAEECADWLTDAMECDSSGSYKIQQGTKIVVSKPLNIQAEWRWFIVDGKVVSGSQYRMRGHLILEMVTDQKMIDEAQEKANGWLPDQCCVMDLAIVNNELKVIEFNCINSSGFYDHNIHKVLLTLFNYTQRNSDATII